MKKYAETEISVIGKVSTYFSDVFSLLRSPSLALGYVLPHDPVNFASPLLRFSCVYFAITPLCFRLHSHALILVFS